jgi:hypothetical protein
MYMELSAFLRCSHHLHGKPGGGYETAWIRQSVRRIWHTYCDRDYSGANCEKPIAVVEEVQLLNSMLTVECTGLGRLFLRILRDWQYRWHKEGIRLLHLVLALLLTGLLT